MRLADYLSQWHDAEYDFDGRSCAHFVAGWLKANGINVPIGRWRTKQGALRWYRRHMPIDGYVDKYLTPIGVAYAQRGDVARVHKEAGDDIDVFGIVDSTVVWTFGDRGLVFVPRAAMVVAWRGARPEVW